MFQLMFAEALRAHRPDALIANVDLPEWNISLPDVPHRAPFKLVVNSHKVPLPYVLRALREIDDIEIELQKLSMRMAFYDGHLPRYRRLFPRDDTEQGGSDDELVISVRLEDVLSGGHKNYFPLPVSTYRKVIDHVGKQPVFMGQIGDDPYSTFLRRTFPEARFVPSRGVMQDFNFIRNSSNIMLPISSFSWLAAWFSETAKQIFLPIAGLFHPDARADIDMIPVSDSRYKFIRTDLHRCDASLELQRLMEDEFPIQFMSGKESRRAFPSIGTDGATRRRR